MNILPLATLSNMKQKLADENAKLLYVTVSGAHLYGFESSDSDIDYRGAYLTNTNNIIGLKNATDQISYVDGNDDVVLFEIKKELQLALKGNCNVLEHLNAKPLAATPEYLNIRRLINNSFGKNGLYNSYKGMAMFNYKKFILGGKVTTKKYLYVFRGLMAGIYALHNGQIQANLSELNKYFKLDEVRQLIEYKKEGTERALPPPAILENGKLELRLQELFSALDEAYSKSGIPEEPDAEDIAKVDSYLKQMRRNYIG